MKNKMTKLTHGFAVISICLLSGCNKEEYVYQFSEGDIVELLVDGSNGQVVSLRHGELGVRTKDYKIKLFSQWEVKHIGR